MHKDIPKYDESFFRIEVLRELFKYEWISRIFLIINIIISFIAVLLNGYVLFIQAGNFLTNYTTYERFSHEGIAARKKRKRYLAKLKQAKTATIRESTISSNFPQDKYRDKESNNSDNAKTTNTLSRNLMGDDSCRYLFF